MFTLLSNTLIVIDPSKNKDMTSSCMIPNVLIGDWNIVAKQDAGKVSQLIVFHESNEEVSSQSLNTRLYVPSCLVGIFDLSQYPDDVGSEADSESFFGRILASPELLIDNAIGSVVRINCDVYGIEIGKNIHEQVVRVKLLIIADNDEIDVEIEE